LTNTDELIDKRLVFVQYAAVET